jgi:hypothetical protein
MRLTIPVVAVIGALLIPAATAAKVVRVEVESREVVADWPADSRPGAYEVLKGMIYLEVDPDDPANRLIADLKLAERNRRGNVEFSTEFELHKPVDADRGNHRLMYFVNNRGHKMGVGHFTHQAGENWLCRKGWSYLWCGWNCDVIQSDRKLNINVPVVTDNGKTITAKTYTEIISYANNVVYSRPLVWGGSIPYPPVNIDEREATLTRRRYRWEDPVEVPRDQWSFARLEDGEVVPDAGYLYVKEGIKPGWLYDLVYTAKNPKLTGLGMAAIRDVVSFFRYETADEAGTPSPLAGLVEHAYSWGHSQSARLLYHYVWQDFNGDENGRIVFDGIIPNCGGGGKGQFNSRFAQTTRHGSHLEEYLYPIDFFPFNTVEQHDPVTDKRGDGLGRARKSGTLPKMFFVNSATDYWTRAASLLHTDVDGKKDAEIDPNVRMYLISGKQHVDARIGVVSRALLTALDQWVSEGVEPPESQIPKISDGTLVDLDAFKAAFPEIPGAQAPPSYYNPYRLDPGPRWDIEGIVDNVPPEAGAPFVCLVPQVDADGNEIAGIRLPEIVVPLATYTGWKMRNPWYSLTLGRNTGRIWRFPRTEEERKQKDDPRAAVSERYPTEAEYLEKTAACIRKLKRRRLLLAEDAVLLAEQAALQAALIEEMRLGDLPFVTKVAMEKGAETGAAYFNKLRDADMLWWFGFGLSEWRFKGSINSKGYELMSAGNLEQAFELFTLNTMIFSRDWNVWDSLGECCEKMKKTDFAIQHFEKSLELNPDNENAKTALERLRKG